MVTFATHTGGEYKRNWFSKLKLRGYTAARFNQNANRLVPNLFIDYWLFIDICGWETIIDPEPFNLYDTVLLIPRHTIYYIEKGNTRSHAVKFHPYTTDSPNFPAWHVEKDKKQCDVIRYELTEGKEEWNDSPYLPKPNTFKDEPRHKHPWRAKRKYY